MSPLSSLELKLLLRNLRESDAAKEEMKHQKKMKKEISKLSATKNQRELDEEGLFGGGGDEESGDEKKEEEPAEGGEENDSKDTEDSGDEKKSGDKGEKGGKGGKLPGAKKLAAASKSPDEEVKSDDVISRLNFIRAGKSLKDKEVSKQLKSYIDSLTPEERKAFFAFSDGIAKIVLGGEKAVEVPSPLDTYSIKISGPGSGGTPPPTKGSSAPSKPKPVQAGSAPPIVVGEGVKTRIREVDVPVSSGRVVPFGSKSHISDLEARIEDMERIRSYQEPGSESRHAFTMALKALKGQLKAAVRRSSLAGNPRVTGVPPLVEKD